MIEASCSWVGFYQEFANKLLAFKNNRAGLISKIAAAYDSAGLPLPRLDDSYLPSDIDPYTVFGLFNKGISSFKREKIVSAFADHFDVQATKPRDYDGIPLLNNLNATFYAFSSDGRRQEDDIDNLWSLFEASLVLADEEVSADRSRFVEAYNKASIQFGVGWRLTVGLYWTRPYTFVNLDSRNRWFIGDMAGAGPAVAEVVPKQNDSANSIHDAERYLSICDAVKSVLGSNECPYAGLPSLSHAAFIESERVNREKKSFAKAADSGTGEGVEAVAAETGVKTLSTVELPAYDKDSFLSEVYLDADAYDVLVNLLHVKKNVILQGAPGVGKTFVAKRLAYSMMGVKDPERVMMVQFHQSYSYEDFIEGYRPSAEGFELEKGVFYSFCKRAAGDVDNDYFFIVDEINRGNLSRIFGELFMLIEGDKRGSENRLQLLYSHEPFYVPDNVYVLGTMNTADRSLAMLDYALRRRFAFFDLAPAFGSDGFTSYLDGLKSIGFNKLIDCVKKLNAAISVDETLGEGFCIGHSYFCGMNPVDVTGEKLSAIVEYELVPMLREYWFDEPLKVREWSDSLRRAIK